MPSSNVRKSVEFFLQHGQAGEHVLLISLGEAVRELIRSSLKDRQECPGAPSTL